MKKLLYIDCLIRGEASRTAKVAEAFLSGVDRTVWAVEHLKLTEEVLSPLNGATLAARQALVDAKDYAAPLFRYAKQFAGADAVVIAAPFWDLSIPALLKVYIEQVSVEGLTFTYGPEGLVGICRGESLTFLTTRGGIYGDGPLEQGSRYLAALREFFGFGAYRCIAAEGLDIVGYDGAGTLERACAEAREAAQAL